MKENYCICYDERFYAPGVLVVDEVNGKLFKIYSGSYFGFADYHIVAAEKGKKDEPDQNFREIIFNADRGSNLYPAVKAFFEATKAAPIKTIDAAQGTNNIRAEKTDTGYALILEKDVLNVKEPTDSINIHAGDNETCKNYHAINGLYNSLYDEAKKTKTNIDENAVLSITAQA